MGTLGALCHAPTLGLVATFVYAAVVLDLMAAREERRLSQSAFGAEYVAYIARTGRFLPRPG